MGERHLRAVRGDGDVPAARAAEPSAAEPSATAPGRRPGRNDAWDDLLERVGLGDQGAYEQLYDMAAGSVLGLAVRVVRDRDMAEDVAQEVLVEVWHRAARFRRDAGSARSWILTIAHRRAVDRVRSEQAHADRLKAHGALPESERAEQDTVVESMHHEWEAARVRAGLSLLTVRQREALELAYYRGFTHREVAQALDVPLGTAKARIRDGLIRLRDAWEEER
ncbi:sigma-70 family RNA polymerase sigma factor [Demequina capsici]|uniref:RNA polymerase sigma factor n=1 Tax=Demequina capsici TaxID=3075620 RepID=A0AA96FB03_9MICO|nr:MULTISPECIES: sigma-70 family RNA polymerase sigma factor [unclassified Demequina]WNM23486.1 sigma-70 family RNA polymerase sigma factor [Demequina sp. OYTSA14]WNM26363.1 sigma-70 family RNA polymerase sigma factor [Demequina sp. PMTSA13]